MMKSKVKLIYGFSISKFPIKIKYFLFFVIFFSNPSFSDQWITEKEKNNFWEKLLESSEKIIDYSIESLGNYLEDLEILIERELENLENFSKKKNLKLIYKTKLIQLDLR